MKLTRNTEWGLIAALVAYIAFTPGIQAVKSALATPVGKAVALAAIVYVYKAVSPLLALLLTISFMRCATWNVWEMFSGAETSCVCEDSNAIWDSESKTCKDAAGKPAGGVKTCTCANGYAWDGGDKGTKTCVAVSGTQPPVPPPTENPTVQAITGGLPGAPTTGGTTAPSAPPMTTPGAAQQMASASPSPMPPSAGVQPGAGTTSGPATM